MLPSDLTDEDVQALLAWGDDPSLEWVVSDWWACDLFGRILVSTSVGGTTLRNLAFYWNAYMTKVEQEGMWASDERDAEFAPYVTGGEYDIGGYLPSRGATPHVSGKSVPPRLDTVLGDEGSESEDEDDWDEEQIDPLAEAGHYSNDALAGLANLARSRLSEPFATLLQDIARLRGDSGGDEGSSSEAEDAGWSTAGSQQQIVPLSAKVGGDKLRQENEDALKDLDKGDWTSYRLLDENGTTWLLIGQTGSTLESWFDELGAGGGTIRMQRKGSTFGRDPGEVTVAGCDDRDAFSRAFAELSRKKVTFVA